MQVRRLAWIHRAAAGVAAAAVWATTGVLAVESQAAPARLGLLPAPWWALTVALPVAAAVLLLRREWVSRPLLLAGLVLLPWLPVPLPAVCLAWAGPLAWWAWGAVLLAIAALAAKRVRNPGPWLHSPRRASVLAAAIAAAIFAGPWASSRLPPTGDEPHYLVIAQSLLRDRDLRVADNYARGEHRSFYPGELPPHLSAPGRAGAVYSIHAPGLPVLVAPALALAGYPGVVALLVVLSALGTALVWRAGFALTRSAGAAWFGWATVTLSAPVALHGSAVYPDPVAGVVVAAVALALAHRRPMPDRAAGPADPTSLAAWGALGTGIAVLPWLHTRLAVLAGVVLGVAAWLALAGPSRRRALAALLGPVAIGTAAWFAFFWVTYGTPNPSAPYGPRAPLDATGAARGLLAFVGDQEFGILPNAPVFVAALAGTATLARLDARAGVAVIAIVVPYLLTVGSYAMWWGGQSAPARLAVPVLFALGAPAAACWARASARGRAVCGTLLGLSLLVTATLALGGDGTLRFNDASGRARWLEWIAPLVDLPSALPSALRDTPPPFWASCATWAMVLLATMWAFTSWDRAVRPTPATRALAAPLCAALGLMTGASVSWGQAGTPPVRATEAQLALVRASHRAGHQIALELDPLRATSPRALLSRLAITSPLPRHAATGPAAEGAPLLELADVPAGTYEVEASPPRGPLHLALVIGAGAAPVERWTAPAGTSSRRRVTLPLPAARLRVVQQPLPPSPGGTPAPVALRPVRVETPAADSLATRSAARYGDLVVHATDDRVWLEETGLWVMAGRRPTLVLLPDAPRATFDVLIRCGPRANQVRLAAGGWSVQVTVAPNEARHVSIRAARDRRATAIVVEAAQGFRPAEVDPGSRDRRLLGCWIEFP
jgi:hypothetical protein